MMNKIAPKGRMYIDIEKKIREATTQEEKNAWENERSKIENIAFCEDWYVGIFKHACGHWEILQSPIYKNMDGSPMIINEKAYTKDADQELRQESAASKCSKCILNDIKQRKGNITLEIRKALAEADDVRENFQKRPMFTIWFTNNEDREDETQFTCESMESAEDELIDFFIIFCAENKFTNAKVTGIMILDDDDEDGE